MTNDEIIEHAKEILHNELDSAMTELLMEQLQAKLDAMTALELSEYINERQRRERARDATQDRHVAQDVLLERQGRGEGRETGQAGGGDRLQQEARGAAQEVNQEITP